MSYSRNYFILTWTYSGVAYTKRFRMMIADANPEGEMNLSGAKRSLDGYLNVTQVTFAPKILEGVVVIEAGDTDPMGTLADLRKAWDRSVTNLTCQRFGDEASWSAYWNGSWKPLPADPLAYNWYVPINLEQVS